MNDKEKHQHCMDIVYGMLLIIKDDDFDKEIKDDIKNELFEIKEEINLLLERWQ
jgi:hypothetical protein